MEWKGENQLLRVEIETLNRRLLHSRQYLKEALASQPDPLHWREKIRQFLIMEEAFDDLHTDAMKFVESRKRSG